MAITREFNSKEYAFVDLSVAFLGRPVGGLRAIEYKVTRQQEALYGAGREPRSIQKGRKGYEGTITLLQSELIALNRAAKIASPFNTDVTDIEFDVIVSYAPEGGLITTDRILNVSIGELPLGIKEGDLFQEIALPFVALGIDFEII